MERNGIMFGRNLQILRSKSGLSQQELADEIHVTRQTVSLWERGQGKPDIYCLHDICGVIWYTCGTDDVWYSVTGMSISSEL